MAEDSMDSLWGEEFTIPQKSKAKEKVKKIAEKISKPKEIKAPVEKQVKSKKISLDEKLKIIEAEVLRVLGKQKDNILVIKDRETFHNYITKAIQNNRIDIDTETNNSLDPITCKLMGPCIYTPGEKQVYIPINHRNPDTKERLNWQLTEKDVQEEFQRIIDAKTFVIMHNGKFDYQVIKCTCGGIELQIDWDTMIAAKLLDENERSAGLKEQYIDKIDPEQEKYSIDHLFEGVEYADVDPEIFAFYASTDAKMTDALYEWQLNKFKDPDLARVLNLFYTIEMPLVQVIAEMELAGMEVDLQYDALLSAKFHRRLDSIDKEISDELLELKPRIDAWRLTKEANLKPILGRTKTIKGIQYKYMIGNPSYWYQASNGSPLTADEALVLGLNATEQKSKAEQLEDPINLGSPTQLAILFYDVLKCPSVSKKSPRGTGEDELKAIAEKLKLSICESLIKRRECVKLLTTYIDAIPELAKRWPDGRVRTHFNQYGAATGRLSSSEPINFQNIPSHEKTIRLIFKSQDNYRIIGGDFSAQEPRLTAFYSQDENMIKAYVEGKDLYSVIASMSFDRKYEDCLEFYPEGTKIIYEGQEVICGHKTHQNKEGKTYRTMAKSILLGKPLGYFGLA